MILKSYLISFRQNVYTQYPNDHTASFLNPLCRNLKTKHQVVVYRDGGLMYYCYYYHSSENETIGICIASGELCVKLKQLYDRFVSCLALFAKRGVAFHFDSNGEICYTNEITQNIGEVEELFRWLLEHTDSGQPNWAEIPPQDHSIAKGTSVLYNFSEDDHRDILEATKHYTYVFITMYNPTPTSYSETVKRLSSEKERLIREKEELTYQIGKINRKKKQYELVIGLAVAMFIGALVAIAIISGKNTMIRNQLATIQNNKETIENQYNTISSQTSKINEQTQSISRLNDCVSELGNQKDSLQTELNILSDKNEALQSEIDVASNRFPMLVSYIEIANVYSGGNIETNYGNSISSSSSLYLKPRINYTGLRSGWISLKIKWYNPDGGLVKGTTSPSDCSFTENVYVDKGKNQRMTLMGWGNNSAGNWKSGTYRLEVWYGSVCLASRSVRIY